MRKETAVFWKLGVLIPAMAIALAGCGNSGAQNQPAEEAAVAEATDMTVAEEKPVEAEVSAEDAAKEEAGAVDTTIAAAEESAVDTTTAAAEESEAPAVGAGAHVYENDGFRLTIPAEYADLLQIEKQQNGVDNVLFCVREKASIEADKAQGGNNDTAGWLFTIGTVSEDKKNEMLCSDMSGADIFAKDEDDTYYVYYHPTDVTLVRDDYEDEEQMAQWTKLNEWAGGMKEAIVKDNIGFAAVAYGNSLPEMYLYRTVYDDNANYTISTTEYGPMEPNDVDPMPYVEKLTTGVSCEYTDDKAPDGEYVVLAFPDEEIRFDFFLAEGGENYVRYVSNTGDEDESEESEQIFKMTFKDSSVKASKIMQEWYNALVDAQ